MTLPTRDAQGRVVWVTRARPKIGSIACPWIIRRLGDLRAVILFVAPPRWRAWRSVATGSLSTSRGVFSHCGKLCSFDVMPREVGLSIDGLPRQWSARRA